MFDTKMAHVARSMQFNFYMRKSLLQFESVAHTERKWCRTWVVKQNRMIRRQSVEMFRDKQDKFIQCALLVRLSVVGQKLFSQAKVKWTKLLQFTWSSERARVSHQLYRIELSRKRFRGKLNLCIIVNSVIFLLPANYVSTTKKLLLFLAPKYDQINYEKTYKNFDRQKTNELIFFRQSFFSCLYNNFTN